MDAAAHEVGGITPDGQVDDLNCPAIDRRRGLMSVITGA